MALQVAPCGSISPEARKFVAQTLGAEWETVDFASAEVVAALRAETSEIATPGCEAVRREFPHVSVEESRISNVAVQWVFPVGQKLGNSTELTRVEDNEDVDDNCAISKKNVNGYEIGLASTKQDIQSQKVILYLHGGGFVSGCPNDDLSITVRLAALLDIYLCIPYYRLAPEHPCPAARKDVFAVHEGLMKSGFEVVAIIGQSAGGNLALGLTLSLLRFPEEKEMKGRSCTMLNRGEIDKEESLMRSREKDFSSLKMPKALVLLSPWADLTHSGESHAIDIDPTLSVKHFLEPAALAYVGDRNPDAQNSEGSADGAHQNGNSIGRNTNISRHHSVNTGPGDPSVVNGAANRIVGSNDDSGKHCHDNLNSEIWCTSSPIVSPLFELLHLSDHCFFSPAFGQETPEQPLMQECQWPHTLLTTGTRDLLLSDAVRIAAKLRKLGSRKDKEMDVACRNGSHNALEVDLQVWEGLWHVFEWHSELPEARESVEEIANFLRKHCSQQCRL